MSLAIERSRDQGDFRHVEADSKTSDRRAG